MIKSVYVKKNIKINEFLSNYVRFLEQLHNQNLFKRGASTLFDMQNTVHIFDLIHDKIITII
jgi:hypothetical protein